MKKLALLLTFALILTVMSVNVFATATRVDTWHTVENKSDFSGTIWGAAGADAITFARLYKSGALMRECNIVAHEFTFTTNAHIAQWIYFNLNGLQWDWFVRKPGDYYGNCISFDLASNGDVAIGFSGFGDLVYQGPLGVKQTIDTYYWATGGPVGMLGTEPQLHLNPTQFFIRAEELNGSYTIPDSLELHNMIELKLWSRIIVEECNTASTYSGSGLVTITLANQKDWIEPSTGEFAQTLGGFVN